MNNRRWCFYMVVALLTAEWSLAQAAVVTLEHQFRYENLVNRSGNSAVPPSLIEGHVRFQIDNSTLTVGSLSDFGLFIDGTEVVTSGVHFETSADENQLDDYLEIDIGDQTISYPGDFRIQYSIPVSQADPYFIGTLSTVNNYGFFHVGGSLFGGRGVFFAQKNADQPSPVPLPGGLSLFATCLAALAFFKILPKRDAESLCGEA